MVMVMGFLSLYAALILYNLCMFVYDFFASAEAAQYLEYLKIEKASRSLKILPVGHPKREKYREIMNAAYKECEDIERKWMIHFPITLKARPARRIINRLSKQFKIDPPSKIILNVSEVKKANFGGSYDTGKKTISFPNQKIFTYVLLHEFTHHLVWETGIMERSSHGPKFCDWEKKVFEAALPISKEILLKKEETSNGSSTGRGTVNDK